MSDYMDIFNPFAGFSLRDWIKERLWRLIVRRCDSREGEDIYYSDCKDERNSGYLTYTCDPECCPRVNKRRSRS